MPQRITPLNIKDAEVYHMARLLAERTGRSMTEVVREALLERLERENRRSPDPALLEELTRIADRCAARPVLDPRSDEEIIGYDSHGLPG